MKKRYWSFILAVIVIYVLFLMPVKKAIIFIPFEEKGSVYYADLYHQTEFQILYTHSIHKSDVLEMYQVTKQNDIRLLSMTYEDLAIGMPGYAEEGQKLEIKEGKHILSYDHEVISEFTLFVSDINMDLKLIVNKQQVDLKKVLQPGESYIVKIEDISVFQMMKGIQVM